MHGGLFGRAAESSLVLNMLDSVGVQGDTLLFTGAVGVGKTALLELAACEAEERGFRVLRVIGAQFESELVFSGLHQLLYPIVSYVEGLAEPHRRVLRHALVMDEGEPSDRFAVSVAVLAALAAAADDRPLLVLVDDEIWIDQDSAEVLAFCARRISGHRIVVVSAARQAASGPLTTAVLRRHQLSPIADEAAETLLQHVHPDLAPRVRAKVVAAADGNPLLLRELPAALTPGQREGIVDLPRFLSSAMRMEPIFVDRILRLPGPTRWAMLLHAFVGEESVAELVASQRGQDFVNALRPAVEGNLMHAEAGWFEFLHPLVKAAVVQLASKDECRRAHAMLAQAAHSEERRTWHRAEAAERPDEEVAVALVRIGDRAARQGGTAAAAEAFLRAAELSPANAERSRLCAKAARWYWRCGQLDRAYALMRRAREVGDADTPSSFEVAVSVYYSCWRSGALDTAHRLLVRFVDEADGRPEQREYALDLLIGLGQCGGRADLWREFDSLLRRQEIELPRMLRMAYEALSNPARAAEEVRERLAEDYAEASSDAGLQLALECGRIAVAIDALSDYRDQLERLADRHSSDDAQVRVMTACSLLSFDYLGCGQWAEAETVGLRGLELAEANAFVMLACQFRAQLAVLAALRGGVDEALALSDEVLAWAEPRGLGIPCGLALWARTLVALAKGDDEQAYVEATRICAPGVVPTASLPALWSSFDLVEAAVRMGRVEEARAHAAAVKDAGIDTISPRTRLLVTGSAALTANEREALKLFEEALAVEGAHRWPFARARVHLAYGVRLRRGKHAANARLHLRTAEELFVRLGAEPWAAMAQAELRLAGETQAMSGHAKLSHTTLTPQEERIARLAASGLTNKQIAARLGLSARTVGAHLYKIFPKLGVATRAGLSNALSALSDGAPR
ncbi:LuxR C-terminal-related transcriptional regulator [Lentzea jiangxiensis]|nr:LuxR family transcriptional regulator [Lentzea jiangxiensis]